MRQTTLALLMGVAIGGIGIAAIPAPGPVLGQDEPQATDVGAYEMRSSQKGVILRGTGKLASGTGVVSLPQSFLDQLDLSKGLDVMVTPTQNCKGLYVASTSSTGFTVQEGENGHCDAEFRWFVVACPK